MEKRNWNQEIKDLILNEFKKGNIAVLTVDGVKIATLKEMTKQPIEGLLYDLNRDEATILTFIDDPKWINDYAMMKVVVELKKQLESKEKKMKQSLQDRVFALANELAIEDFGELASIMHQIHNSLPTTPLK